MERIKQMKDWNTYLAEADDDYLVGIANKGLLKRAYKDKEENNYQVLSIEDEAKVNVGSETVFIRMPLGESRCSCPSRSICRHIILGILALREQVLGNAAGSTPLERYAEALQPSQLNIQSENTEISHKNQEKLQVSQAVSQSENTETPQKNQEKQQVSQAVSQSENTENIENKKAAAINKQPNNYSDFAENKMPNSSQSEQTRKDNLSIQLQTCIKVQEEISAYPLSAIRKALGSRYLQLFCTQAKAKAVPPITISSVITVDLAAQGQRVKLLSPLEYSTCTCHKKELCIHKAAALLWCKLEWGVVTLEEINEDFNQSPLQREQIHEAAGQMKQFLEELLDMGLARVSPDALDYMERLAMISHNARLANFEGYWRALRDSYENYFKRKASFRVAALMEQQARLYRRPQLLLEAKNDGAFAELAGEFKADYLPVGTLDLIGIAMERYKSQAGYEGETIYFLEEHTKQWYTFSSARPVFYEKSARRGKPEKKAAPWGLPVSIEELAKTKVHLTDAKADIRRRLSSSQDTRGWIAGNRKGADILCVEDLGNWYYRDFAALYTEQIGTRKRPWLKEQEAQIDSIDLVFLRPTYCESAVFSETEQKLFLSLFDAQNREVIVEVAYSKVDLWGIRYLEKITTKTLPCFLGKLYYRGGRMRLYPVAVFEKEELCEDGL